ncbi:MAG: molybdopterin biosynthesis protein [Eubacteriales bacterium]|nr:molybdopterin biosynthesis protein [Eubacteriales bacterium]
MGKRNLYLKTISVEEALDRYKKALLPVLEKKWEDIPVAESLGRVTKAAVYAKYCSPLFNAAAMDGIAVDSKKTEGALETAPVELKAGEDYLVVDTGDPVHPPYDAVIMAEDLLETEHEDCVRIVEAAAPWQHVRPVGEDIVAGEMILPGHHRIRPIDVGVLLSGGITQISVAAKPRVAIFPTGTEIIEPGETPQEGSIIESNSRMFEGLVKEQGGQALRFPVIPDDYEKIRESIRKASEEFDMVIINAGSSAGTEDYTVHVLRELGEVIVHGVSIKPGKPVILAVVNNRPVIGLPGYPVSAYIAFENFAAPVLAMLTGAPVSKNAMVPAVISRRLVSSLKHREYVRVKVGQVGEKMVAAPLARGAGAAMSLVRADGFCIIPQNSEGAEAGDTVDVELYRSLEEVQSTVMITGSHDLILDVASDLMTEHFPGAYLSSTHVGSMGGLMALKRKETHIAPIHLLDEESGVYNQTYLKKMFREPVVLIKGVGRIQGLMVKKGNPLDIHGIADLKKGRFVNRQRGAGTRILLDYLLKKEGILPEEIQGYGCEAATHMAVAAQVAGEGADVGMGIASAAKAMDLDFIPVGKEEYDFALYKESLELPHVQAFLKLLQSEAFHEKLRELGGYTWEHTGELVEINT